ncbi:MAG: ABC transporter permease subunit [Saprospiraceae bacterium]|nr:ABC transporter permease subunit [Saprospiraceae bacterium]
MSLFKLRGELGYAHRIVLAVLGGLITLAIWWVLAEALSSQRPVVEGGLRELPSLLDTTITKVQRDSILRQDSLLTASASTFEKVYPVLPPPSKIPDAYRQLIAHDQLIANTSRSIWLNIQGYLWALLIALPIGFVLGLIPLFRGLFSRQIDALRYLPLSALTSLFIVWFGLEDTMKIAFLAFGILVYLLPVIVQRIREVEDVYVQTAFTLSATNWQTFRSVYLPAVFSRLMDDIRVLTAISWTYIIIAELLNRQGGIGGLIFIKSKMGQIDRVFAMLLLIIVIGFLQDRLLSYIDTRLNPHKYLKYKWPGVQECQYGIFFILLTLLAKALLPSYIPEVVVWIAVVVGIVMIVLGELKLASASKLK